MDSHRAHNESLLSGAQRLFFDGYFGEEFDTASMLDKLYSDGSSGYVPPAAIIFEPVQGEGGLNVASRRWAQEIQKIARKNGALLIVDEIQTGSGRIGPFFAFERLGIQPDIVVIAKSTSGFGLPLSLVLIKPELDEWEPGEHNGTFRGNNHAFVTSTTALRKYWTDQRLEATIERNAGRIAEVLDTLCVEYGCKRKGLGMMQGVEVFNSGNATRLRKACFDRGIILELSGPNDSVVKIMPPLNIESELLEQGLSSVASAFSDVF